MQLFSEQDLADHKGAIKAAKSKRHVAAPKDWRAEPPAPLTPITDAKREVLRKAFALALDAADETAIAGLMRKYNLTRISAVTPQHFDNLHFDLVMLAL